MTERIYLCTPTDGGAPRIVVARNQAQAYRHLARMSWTMDTPSALDVALLLQRAETAVKIEHAGIAEDAEDCD